MSKTIIGTKREEVKVGTIVKSFGQDRQNRTIGIVYTPFNNSGRKNEFYLEFARQFGTPRYIMPDEFRDDLDLLIIPGGKDLPSTHKAFLPSLSYQHGDTDPYLEFFRVYLLDSYLENNTSIFGICYGFQLLAAHFNSKMFPHIPGHEEGFHKIITSDLTIKVNSFHHQCVRVLGDDLVPIGIATTDGEEVECVEAFKHKSLLVGGVQWHPERMENLLSSSTYKQTGSLRGDLITHKLINELFPIKYEK